jgi:hypothetical protein
VRGSTIGKPTIPTWPLVEEYALAMLMIHRRDFGMMKSIEELKGFTVAAAIAAGGPPSLQLWSATSTTRPCCESTYAG